MKSFLSVIPAWRGGNLKQVVDDCVSSPWRNSPGFYPEVLIVTHKDNTETLEKAKGLADQYNNVDVLYGGKNGKTNFAREALNHVYGRKGNFNSYYNTLFKSDLMGFIDQDGQQKWSEAFSMVNELEDYDVGHIQRKRPIKMKPDKIESQAVLNEIVYKVLESGGQDVSSLSEDPNSGLGPGRGVKDLQNNVCGTYDAFRRIGPDILGENYSFELEVTLLSLKDPEIKIKWGKRNDYGEPGPTNPERLAENLAEKLWVTSKHLSVPLPEIRKIADGLEFENEFVHLKDEVLGPSFVIAENYF